MRLLGGMNPLIVCLCSLGSSNIDNKVATSIAEALKITSGPLTKLE